MIETVTKASTSSLADADDSAVVTPTLPTPWDPFQIMDRLDEEALRKELEGVSTTDLVYVVREGGQEVVGLSKTGVDECCMMLVAQGKAIREEDLTYDVIGENEEREALFKVKAAQFAVSPTGQEVRLNQVIGVKRQPLYFAPAALALDAKAAGKKFKGQTYRQLLGTNEGREYLEWMAEHFSEPEIRDFCRRILASEEVVLQREKQLNPFWYEAGAMKAARNARFRLIPASVRAQVIATARQSGRTRVIEAQPGTLAGTSKAAPPASASPRMEQAVPAPASGRLAESVEGLSRVGPTAPTEKQIAFYLRLAESPVFTKEERKRALEWLETKATRQSIKDQIDWLKHQVETRHTAGAART